MKRGAPLNCGMAALAKPLDRVLDSARQNRVRLTGEVLINFVLPYDIYDHAKPALGEVNALIASSGRPVAWSLVEFAHRRRVASAGVERHEDAAEQHEAEHQPDELLAQPPAQGLARQP